MTSRDAITCGEYELFERIGTGGMGSVWRGRHRRTDRVVALKILEVEIAEEQGELEWFRREIRAHARLEHPNIVRLFDLGEIDSEAAGAEREFVRGAPYFVMEYLPTGTLRRGIVLSAWRELRGVLEDILRGLSFAHARDVIHRDLKPSNLLCRQREDGLQVKISDFGLAFEQVSRDEPRGSSSQMVGTPDYMAPEQLGGHWRKYGPWTDLYALGCIAFELATGRRPYPGSRPAEIASKHLREPVPELEPRFPVPEGFADWVRLLMAKVPSERYWSAADAAYALDNIGTVRASESTKERSLGELDESSGDLPSVRPRTTRREALSGKTATLPSPIASSGASDSSSPTESVDFDEVESVHGGERPGVIPPLPEDWRREAELEAGEPAPLGLFGLRELPFVDRVVERNRLWEGLRAVLDGDEARATLVSGEAGVGKSRVVEWIGRRGVECGACTMLRARHSRQGGPDEGLTGLLQDIFVTWGMTRAEVRRELRSTLELWFDEGSSERDLELDVRALTELVRPMGRSSSFRFVAIRERFALIARILRRLAGRRPLFLWFDDISRSQLTAEFVEYFLEEEEAAEIFVVMTARSDELRALQEAEGPSPIDRIASLDRCGSMELEPLTRLEHQELIDRMLALEPGLAESVVERTEGTPLFAVELLRNWVERDALTPTESGYALREGIDRSIPDDLHRLWQRRFEHAAEALPKEDRSAAVRSIEIAAVLGEQVTAQEWEVACRLAGTHASDLLVDQMIEQGLVFAEPAGWRFEHGMFVESLARRARERGRYERYAHACAEAIEHCYPGQMRETAGRRARYLHEAGAIEVAADVYLVAIDRALQLGAVGEAGVLLEKREEVLDELRVAPEDRARVEQRLKKGAHLGNIGRHRDGRDHVEFVLDVAGERQWPSIEAEARLQQSAVMHREGRQGQALSALERAEEILRALGDQRQLGHALRRRAVIYLWGGFAESAYEAAEAAEGQFDAIGDFPEVCRARTWRVYAIIYGGRFDEARERADELLEEARKHGLRWVERESLNQLGEIARYEERWEESRDYYERYRELNRKSGLFDTRVADLNLGLVEIGRGEFERAERIFEELRTAVDEGTRHLLPTLELGRLAAGAGLGASDVDERFDAIEEVFEEIETREPTQKWVARRASAEFRRRGEEARSERICRLAGVERVEEGR